MRFHLTVRLAMAFGLAFAATTRAESPPDPVAPLYDNLGNIHFPITTSSEVAQKYFDQGLRLGYGFWWSEARRSFEEAVRQDLESPMVYWGKAWAFGPYINNGNPAERELETAYEAIQKARELSSRGTEMERALIDALARRYDKDPSADRGPLDRAYFEAMKKVSEQFPEDVDVLTLAAAAYMNTTRWDYWTKEGKAKPGTPWLVETLEKALDKTIEHAGAHHYYIHGVEASDRPERTVPSARALAAMMPGVAHLVHMSSHILIQTGHYDEASDLNIDAALADELYIGRPDQEGRYPVGSYHHNVHFTWSAATFEGRSAVAIAEGRKLREKVYQQRTHKDLKESSRVQLYASIPYFAMVRFGKWEDMLSTPAPNEEYLFETAMWHYGRGVAFLGKDKPDEAKDEHAKLEAILLRDDVPGMGRISTADMLRLATATLGGEIAAKEARYNEAIGLLEEAVSYQDNLAYTEPPPWHYPLRQSLGAVLLEAGRPQEAEAVYRQDLKTLA